MTQFSETVVEQAVVAWLESPDWSVMNGADIAPGESAAERDDYGQVVLVQRLRNSLLPVVSNDLRFKDAEKFLGRTV